MRFIPSVSKGFCGRENELNELIEFFPCQKIIHIAGIGGVGKTALAVALANHLEQVEKYTGKNIWVKCKTGWKIGDLYAGIIQSAVNLTGDCDCSKHDNLTERDVVAILEKHSLNLFLDDYQFVEIEKSNNLLIVAIEYLNEGRIVLTSRKRLDLAPEFYADICEKRLSGLNPQDCTQLAEFLLASHGFNDVPKKRIQNIINISRGHPYQLKLLVSMVTTGRFTTDSYSGKKDSVDETIRFSLLNDMWELLGGNERELMIRLSISRIPVSPEMSFLKTDENRKSLNILAERYLVEFNGFGNVFMHDLVKDFSSTKASDDKKIEFHFQIADQFSESTSADVSALKEAYYHYHEAGEIEKAIDVILRLGKGFLTLGVETEYIFHLLGDAIDTCNGYRLQEIIMTRIEFLLLWNNFQEAENMIDMLNGEKEKVLILGKLNYYKCCFEESCVYFEKALELDISEEEKLAAYINLSLGYSNLGKAEKTEEYLRKTQEQGIEKYPLLMVKYYWRNAIFQADLGGIYKAIEYTEKAEEICREFNASSQLAKIIYSRALYYSEIKEMDKALDLLEESRELYDVLNDQNGVAYCHFLKGKIHFSCLRFDEACVEKKKALFLADKHGWTFFQAWLNNDLGMMLTRMGLLEEAEIHFNRSFEIYRDINNPEAFSLLCVNYSTLLIIMGNIEKAKNILKQGRDFALASNQPGFKSRYLFYQSLVKGLEGNNEERDRFEAQCMDLLKNLAIPVQENLRDEFNWIREKLVAGEEKLYLMLRFNKKREEITAENLEEIRKTKHEYEVFVDFAGRELLVKGKERKLFNRKVLTAVLFELCSSPGKEVKKSELFQRVWKRVYEPFEDGSTLRSGVSRLRKILDPDDKEHFVCSSFDSPGSLYFNDQCNYCIVMINNIE